MVEVEMAVTKPLPLTVAVRVWLAAPNVPMLLLTVPRVNAPELFMDASPLIVTKVGALAVTPTNSWPLMPTVVVLMGDEPLPSSKAFDVKAPWPVPPLGTDNWPVKPGVKVCMPPADVMASVMFASVPVAKVCVAFVWPFKDVMAPEAVAQLVQASPETAVDDATKHKPSLPTVCMPTTPEPVPENNPPLAMPPALRPNPPDVNPSGWDSVRFVIVVVANVEVALTVKPAAPLKVKPDEVATAFVPLPNKTSLAVKLFAPVPPLETFKTFVMLPPDRLMGLAVICWPLMVK